MRHRLHETDGGIKLAWLVGEPRNYTMLFPYAQSKNAQLILLPEQRCRCGESTTTVSLPYLGQWSLQKSIKTAEWKKNEDVSEITFDGVTESESLPTMRGDPNAFLNTETDWPKCSKRIKPVLGDVSEIPNSTTRNSDTNSKLSLMCLFSKGGQISQLPSEILGIELLAVWHLDIFCFSKSHQTDEKCLLGPVWIFAASLSLSIEAVCLSKECFYNLR